MIRPHQTTPLTVTLPTLLVLFLLPFIAVVIACSLCVCFALRRPLYRLYRCNRGKHRSTWSYVHAATLCSKILGSEARGAMNARYQSPRCDRLSYVLLYDRETVLSSQRFCELTENGRDIGDDRPRVPSVNEAIDSCLEIRAASDQRPAIRQLGQPPCSVLAANRDRKAEGMEGGLGRQVARC